MLGAALVPTGGRPASPSPRHNSLVRNLVVILTLVVILRPISLLGLMMPTRLADTTTVSHRPLIKAQR